MGGNSPFFASPSKTPAHLVQEAYRRAYWQQKVTNFFDLKPRECLSQSLLWEDQRLVDFCQALEDKTLTVKCESLKGPDARSIFNRDRATIRRALGTLWVEHFQKVGDFRSTLQLLLLIPRIPWLFPYLVLILETPPPPGPSDQPCSFEDRFKRAIAEDFYGGQSYPENQGIAVLFNVLHTRLTRFLENPTIASHLQKGNIFCLDAMHTQIAVLMNVANSQKALHQLKDLVIDVYSKHKLIPRYGIPARLFRLLELTRFFMRAVYAGTLKDGIEAWHTSDSRASSIIENYKAIYGPVSRIILDDYHRLRAALDPDKPALKSYYDRLVDYLKDNDLIPPPASESGRQPPPAPALNTKVDEAIRDRFDLFVFLGNLVRQTSTDSCAAAARHSV